MKRVPLIAAALTASLCHFITGAAAASNGNWYTTLLNAHGNPIQHYGDLDLEMARKKLPQTGSIQQFMT